MKRAGTPVREGRPKREVETGVEGAQEEKGLNRLDRALPLLMQACCLSRGTLTQGEEGFLESCPGVRVLPTPFARIRLWGVSPQKEAGWGSGFRLSRRVWPKIVSSYLG